MYSCIRYAVLTLRSTAVLLVLGVPLLARADYMSTTISLASLPKTITLCRDPNSYAPNYFDEEWLIQLDVDHNTATGDRSGVDALFVIQTVVVQTPCKPQTVPTEGNIVATLFQWAGGGSQQFLPSATPAFLRLDFNHSTIVVRSPMTGPLVGLNSQSVVDVASLAGYTSGPTVITADDFTNIFKFGTATTSPANDVDDCRTECQGQPWYSMIDIVGASTSQLDIVFENDFEP
jgi:hypothetical protein